MRLSDGTRAARLVLLLVALLVPLATAMIAGRMEQSLLEAARERGLERAYHLRAQLQGHAVDEDAVLSRDFDEAHAQDPALAAVGLQRGGALAGEGDENLLLLVNPQWTRRLLDAAAAGRDVPVMRETADHGFIGIAVPEAPGGTPGALWLAYDRRELRSFAADAVARLAPHAAWVAVGLALALWAAVGLWTRDAQRRLQLAVQAIADDTAQARERGPADIVRAAESARSRWAPRGDWWLLAVVLGLCGAALAQIGWTAQDELSARTGPWDLLDDVALVMVVSLVLMRELMAAVWERSVVKPYLAFGLRWREWRRRARVLERAGEDKRLERLDWLAEVRSGVRDFARQAEARLRGEALTDTGTQLVKLRLVAFLAALSEELIRPFFAVVAAEAAPIGPFSPTLLAGIPVAGFMLAWALSQPIGPALTSRFDARRSLFAVACAGTVFMALTALAHTGGQLLVLRAASGLAYGLVLILCQTTIVRMTDYATRARGLVEVSTALVAAGACGPALGGALADRFGPASAFATSAAALLACAVVASRVRPLAGGTRANIAGPAGWRGLAAVMAQPQVAAVTWLVAIPGRLVAAALLVVVTPLYLLQGGETATTSGRVLLLYFLAFMVVAPMVARRSDRARSRKPWVIGGGLAAAASCAALPLVGGVAGAALCTALLGIAQAMHTPTQVALVTDAFDRDPGATQHVGATAEQGLAAFRLMERLGGAVAPFAAAGLAAVFGLAGSVGAIGAGLGAGALALAGALSRYDEGRRRKGHG